MRWNPYAAAPGRRGVQVLGDLAVLVWVWVCLWAGRAVHDVVAALAGPGLLLRDGAAGVAADMRAAAEAAGGVPFLGDGLARPFESAGGAATQIADAGARQAELVLDAALALGLLAGLAPLLPVLGLWLALRVRFTRRAAATRALVAAGPDQRLFALRALATRPVHRLARVCADPVAAWRADDARVVGALAALELRAAGVAVPPPAAVGGPPHLAGRPGG
jgi:hypothetical protein